MRSIEVESMHEKQRTNCARAKHFQSSRDLFDCAFCSSLLSAHEDWGHCHDRSYTYIYVLSSSVWKKQLFFLYSRSFLVRSLSIRFEHLQRTCTFSTCIFCYCYYFSWCKCISIYTRITCISLWLSCLIESMKKIMPEYEQQATTTLSNNENSDWNETKRKTLQQFCFFCGSTLQKNIFSLEIYRTLSTYIHSM